jgi:hypothetical protein
VGTKWSPTRLSVWSDHQGDVHGENHGSWFNEDPPTLGSSTGLCLQWNDRYTKMTHVYVGIIANGRH